MTLQEDAAKKIARLAEGSMRDALTYLDQCYAMANEEITLDNVNETLGLISDESLDEIISAVKAKERVAVGRAITKAFCSGLAANAINESLITRLRDIEFDMLGTDDRNFSELDKMIDALRAAAGEMNGSGIPDIILEMTLMKLATPVQSFVAPPIVALQTSRNENLDEGQKIFYDTLGLLSKEGFALTKIFDKATVTSFTGKEMTLGFRGRGAAGLFKSHQQQFEEAVARVAGRAIKVSVVVNEHLLSPVLRNMPEDERANLEGAMNILNASDVTKIKD